jgi:GNAT superfamily N-acetyltransferase
MSVEIRPATAEDLAVIPAIELSAASAFEGRDVPADLLTTVSGADTWLPQLAAGTLWVATINGTVSAFLAATADADHLHVDEVDVLRQAQGHGVGRRLMAHAIDWARRQALGRVTLTTFTDVPWNAPFYSTLGFKAWPEGEAPPELAAKVNAERARGLKNRCAMRLEL